MSTDYPSALKDLLEHSASSAWVPVLANWVSRFDGWWEFDRGEQRDPAYAIAFEGIKRTPLVGDARRDALFLAHLPFNRWHAAKPSGEMKWDPLYQPFRSYLDALHPEPVVTFVVPSFEDQRIAQTSHWLWAMWRLENLKQSPNV